MVLVNYIVNSK